MLRHDSKTYVIAVLPVTLFRSGSCAASLPRHIHESPHMTTKEKLHQAVLTMLTLEEAGGKPALDQARVLTDVLVAFAEVVRGQVPEVSALEVCVDDVPNQLLLELRQLNDHLRHERELTKRQVDPL